LFIFICYYTNVLRSTHFFNAGSPASPEGRNPS
jgi:hypothetical protein